MALAQIGKAAVPELIARAKDNDTEMRYYAIWSLGLIGPDAQPAVPEVLRLLNDKHDDVRRKAAYTLRRIAPKPRMPYLPWLLRSKIITRRWFSRRWNPW